MDASGVDASGMDASGVDAWVTMAPDLFVGRLHADTARIRAEKRRLIFILIFTHFRFLNMIVFYILCSMIWRIKRPDQ
jgi:hypothetical protein